MDFSRNGICNARACKQLDHLVSKAAGAMSARPSAYCWQCDYDVGLSKISLYRFDVSSHVATARDDNLGFPILSLRTRGHLRRRTALDLSEPKTRIQETRQNDCGKGKSYSRDCFNHCYLRTLPIIGSGFALNGVRTDVSSKRLRLTEKSFPL